MAAVVLFPTLDNRAQAELRSQVPATQSSRWHRKAGTRVLAPHLRRTALKKGDRAPLIRERQRPMQLVAPLVPVVCLD